MSRPTFLSASWRHLCLLNYEIDPNILKSHLPYGTELDFIDGKTYVSVVAFMFYNTKALGIVPALFHQTFEEVNLRFYVTRKENGQIKRGVVFVKEVVPKPVLAWVARKFYCENYVAMPMSHKIEQSKSYEYQWGPHQLKVTSNGKKITADESSLERWITEHYWGYTKVSDAFTYEYEVKHPIWDLYQVESHSLKAEIATLYGKEFEAALAAAPSSVFLADGSEVSVHYPRSIRA